MDGYKNYLIKKIGMSTADADLILSGFELVEYKKGELLQEEGDKCKTVRILLKGCSRGFVVDDGKEITTNFYFKYDHVYDYVYFLLQQRGKINIQALDSIQAIELSAEALDFLHSEVIGFHRMSFQMFKMNIIKSESQRLDFTINNPKQRYLELLKNYKQIISRVPQHQVASFIGISAEHLSRIRKEIRDVV